MGQKYFSHMGKKYICFYAVDNDLVEGKKTVDAGEKGRSVGEMSLSRRQGTGLTNR